MNNDTDAMQLKPCPFCGNAGDIEQGPASQASDAHCAYRGWCDHCGFGLEWTTDHREAIAAWNTRTTSLAAQDGLVDAREIRRIASIFKQWRSTLMLSKMDGEQWRSINKAFDDLEALSAIKG